jgi:hypothetical protein
MDRDSLVRRALWATVGFNLLGAFIFGFPASPAARLAGLPLEVPALYRGVAAVFILLFAGAYAWVALQPVVSRPFVAFAAIGKASVFVLALALWMASTTSALTVLAFGGDLAFAALFTWWLVVTSAPGARA